MQTRNLTRGPAGKDVRRAVDAIAKPLAGGTAAGVWGRSALSECSLLGRGPREEGPGGCAESRSAVSKVYPLFVFVKKISTLQLNGPVHAAAYISNCNWSLLFENTRLTPESHARQSWAHTSRPRVPAATPRGRPARCLSRGCPSALLRLVPRIRDSGDHRHNH